jgi:hypothetical protein
LITKQQPGIIKIYSEKGISSWWQQKDVMKVIAVAGRQSKFVAVTEKKIVVVAERS